MCNKKSGLLGISGASNDVRNLVELAAEGHERANLAIDVFCYRIKKYIGAYTAALGVVDAVVFTGGIGENAVHLRSRICSDMTQIGIELDQAANQGAQATETQISADDSRIAVFVIPTNEQAAIANDTYELTGQSEPIAFEQCAVSARPEIASRSCSIRHRSRLSLARLVLFCVALLRFAALP